MDGVAQGKLLGRQYRYRVKGGGRKGDGGDGQMWRPRDGMRKQHAGQSGSGGP